MEVRIIRFLNRHHVLTLATTSDLGSWTAHCFYAYLPEHQALVFTTDPETRHGKDMLSNPKVSAGIALETKVIGKIRGIQLTGTVEFCTALVIPTKVGTPSAQVRTAKVSPDRARSAYLRRFPFALATKLDLWILYIDYIKMTDNRLGFGKKIQWNR